jgi:ribosome maturation factor RimP
MCIGEKVEIKLYAPKNGAKTFTGILNGLDEDGRVAVDLNGEVTVFEKNEIAKIHTVFDF